MSKAWSKVAIAWLAAASLALAQPAAPPTNGAPGDAMPPDPTLPAGFKPEKCFSAPQPSCPTPPLVSGIIAHEEEPVAWARYDQLFWWVRQGPVPMPLVTTSTLTAIPPIQPGALNDPNAKVITGTTPLVYNNFNGGRFVAGMWLNYDHTFGVEASGFLTESRAAKLMASSDDTGVPLLAQPYFDPNRNTEFVISLAIPGFQSGKFFLDSRIRLGGGEGNIINPLMEWDDMRLLGMWGFHYFNVSELLQLTATTGNIAPFPFPVNTLFFEGTPVNFPQTLTYRDQFKTLNQFYGGQVGARWEWNFADRFRLEALEGEVALGSIQNQVVVLGSTQLNATANGPVLRQAVGSFYAQNSNIGKHDRTTFSAMPSADFQLQYELFPNFWITAGYNGLAVTSVVRPAEQIDRTINTSQAPGLADFGKFPNGPSRPLVPFQDTTFWAHGFDFGLKLTY